MLPQTLLEANRINARLEQLKRTLNCFELFPEKEPNDITVFYGLNPRLIIEYDGDGREREREEVPAALSNELVDVLKKFINDEISKLQIEFDAL